MAIIQQLLKDNSGVIRTSDAANAGIFRATLSQLVKDGKLERIARGQYIHPEDMPDELLLLQQRSNKIIFSHETALFLHGLAERTPLAHSITVPRGSNMSGHFFEDCKVYHVKAELHSLGQCMVKSNMGSEIAAYNVERTICDILRSRNRVDSQTVSAAMKNYVASSKQDWTKLREYSEAFRVTKLLRQYLEVLT